MKKINQTLLFLSVLLWAGSCSKDDTMNDRSVRKVVLTGFPSPETKAEFAEADNSSVKFAWSPYDRIWVNGQRSSLVQSTDNAGFAEFIFDGLSGEAPYKVYYNPAGTEAGNPYNEAIIPPRTDAVCSLFD